MPQITTADSVTIQSDDFWVQNAAAATNEQFTEQSSVTGNLVLGIGNVVANYDEYRFDSGEFTYRYIGNWEVAIEGALLTATTGIQGYYEQIIVEKNGVFYASLDLDQPLTVDFGTETSIDLLGLGMSGLTSPLLAAILGGEPTASLDNLHLAADPDLPEEAGLDADATIANGSAGADTLTGTAGNDVISGLAGNDRINGLSGNDTLSGDGGNDILFGGLGNDILRGGDGNDTLNGGAGADRLIGGAGTDTASYSGASAGVTASLSSPASNRGDAAGDTYSSIENLSGTQFNDRLIGNAAANVLSGGDGNDSLQGLGGNDVLSGGNGNDRLDGGAGADRLLGGAGIDTAVYSSAQGSVTASLSNAKLNSGDAAGDTYSSVENLLGSKFSDTLFGNSGSNSISGGNGNDVLRGYAGNDALSGNNGNDKLIGDAGNDVLYGGAGNDILIGGSGADRLVGGTGADRMSGGDGNDKLYGGYGKDVLSGGAGKDIFVFDVKLGSTNVDKIVDFSVRDDTIWLDNDVFQALGSAGDLSSSAFHTGKAAHDASDRIIYDKSTGKLFYDADGTGQADAIQFAQLHKGLNLTAADFDIIG